MTNVVAMDLEKEVHFFDYHADSELIDKFDPVLLFRSTPILFLRHLQCDQLEMCCKLPHNIIDEAGDSSYIQRAI